MECAIVFSTPENPRVKRGITKNGIFNGKIFGTGKLNDCQYYTDQGNLAGVHREKQKNTDKETFSTVNRNSHILSPPSCRA